MSELNLKIIKHKSRNEHGIAYEYSIWKSMIKRCCPSSSKRNPTYADCTVVDEWLDYQSFAEWYKNNEFYGLGYDLDKDILSGEVGIYSPETCLLIPRHINIIFSKPRRHTKHDLPVGVHYQKRNNYKKYGARLSITTESGSHQKHLGYFRCPQEAHQAYVIAKEAYVKEVANKWHGRIDDRVYEALMSWTVNP